MLSGRSASGASRALWPRNASTCQSRSAKPSPQQRQVPRESARGISRHRTIDCMLHWGCGMQPWREKGEKQYGHNCSERAAMTATIAT
eukprot:1581173-Lingulodinium_polyedra.AAC.1